MINLNVKWNKIENGVIEGVTDHPYLTSRSVIIRPLENSDGYTIEITGLMSHLHGEAYTVNGQQMPHKLRSFVSDMKTVARIPNSYVDTLTHELNPEPVEKPKEFSILPLDVITLEVATWRKKSGGLYYPTPIPEHPLLYREGKSPVVLLSRTDRHQLRFWSTYRLEGALVKAPGIEQTIKTVIGKPFFVASITEEQAEGLITNRD